MNTLKTILFIICIILLLIQTIMYFAKCKQAENYKKIAEDLEQELIDRRINN